MQKYFKKVLKWSVTFLLIGVSLLIIASCFIYYKKDDVLNQVLNHLNDDFKGLVKIKEADISPFENFPYVSVKLNELKIYESKQTDSLPILNLETAYLGFDFWKIIKNELVIKKLSLQNGEINIVQDQLGLYNIAKAFESRNLTEESKKVETKPLLFNFKSISLKNIAIKKESLVTKILVETNIKNAEASFNKTVEAIKFKLDSKFVLNILNNGKPNYIYHKNLELHTDFVFDKKTHVINFLKTSVLLEGADFDMKGKIDIDDDLFVDLYFSGNKPNFDLVIGFAPEELIPTLKSYKNKGKVFFDAHVKGKTANNQIPAINAKFGCKDGYIINPDVNKKIDKLGFLCTFTNGKDRSNATSIFELKDFNAKPEAGNFKAKLTVNNFDSPEIDLQLDSDFDLDFLTKFFRLKDIKNLSGKVLLTMNFHDIIDLQNPEKALEKLNQAYFSDLEIKNLNFQSDAYHLPIENLNVKANIKGETLNLSNCSFKLGESDLAIKGKINNIPAVIHQSKEAIEAELHIRSKALDIAQLTPKTSGKDPFDEKLSDLKFDLAFKGLANTFISSKSLPVGNYYLTNINTKLKNYHHQLNNFNGTFYINKNDVLIKRLDGRLDTSDFHFKGKIGHYDLWLADLKKGDTDIDFDLTSKYIHFKDVFTYKGQNFIPKEYRNEDLKDLKLHGHVTMHYNDSLHSTEFYLTELKGKLKMHPLKFDKFNGHVGLKNDLLTIHKFAGYLGENDFKLTGKYYLNNNNTFSNINFLSQRLNINEIISYNPPITEGKIDHDAGYNILAEPFPNLNISAKISDLRFNKYHLTNLTANVNVKKNHFVYLNKLQFNAANGLIDMSGYFNGSNPKHIYLNPDIKIQKVNLDEVLFKFDNFGQDVLISENLHGITSGRIKGKIWLHTDFTPSIEDSDLTIDVSIENGRLDNFAPMQAMSTYFGDKNLNRIKFDKLENRLTLKNGKLSIPNMLINSSLGYMEIAGNQDLDLNMDYYLRIPLKLVGKASFNKLFKTKLEEISPEQEDELIIKDPEKRTRFVNVRLLGTPEKYDINLQKNKELKAGVRFDKTEDFLFKTIESEFEENRKQ